MDEMKVVVTGGAGFIGSNLAETLANSGEEVVIIDDLTTGKIENIGELLKRERVRFVNGCVTDLKLLKEVFKGAEIVYHLAAIPSVPRSIREPVRSNDVNINGTLNVLIAARECGVRKVAYASSSSVYGDTPSLPKREDMNPNPLSPYAVTKLTGEYYCRVFQEVYGLETVALRYFNVYGPRQDPFSEYAAVIPKFIQRALKGMPPVIYGDGEQTRDFTFVKDVVEGTIILARNATGVFNIGRGEQISINRLAALILEITNLDLEPIHEQPRTGDVKHSLADISRAKSYGYAPKYGVEEGVKETVRWFSSSVAGKTPVDSPS